jgi:proteasome accessory factor A
MIGIETEYGIWVEGKGAQDLVSEATYLVQGCPPPAIAGRWDYTREHPRRDVRGFTVSQLSIDPTDAQFEQAGSPHSTDVEVRADRVLPSGARLYNDHGHPEFATPECTSLRELLAHDRAGERWMQTLAERRSHKLGGTPVALYKNNTDFHGASYGTHESYLFARAVPFDDVIQSLLPFFTTRQIFAGAGKVGSENGAPKTDFQLSQRADFFSTIASVDTLYNRPLINTRDEPHADARRFRRLHVICGDANLCEVATLLKCGTTLLILRLLEQGWRPEGVALADPVAAVKQISHDPTFQWLVARASGGSIGAVEIQRVYLSGAKERLTGLSPETDLVLTEWEAVLNALETDPLSLDGTLDWVTKRQLLDGFREAEGLRWDDAHLQSLDLEYHNVDPGAGLYLALEQEGHVRRIVEEPEILAALKNPPAGSPRAIARGIAACRFPDAVKRVTWSRITLEEPGGQSKNVSLAALGEADPAAVSTALRDVQMPAEFIATLEGLTHSADNVSEEE